MDSTLVSMLRMVLTWDFHPNIGDILSVPKPVGRIHFEQPRAVQVREPENLEAVHSAIHCGLNIYTDSRNETEYLLKNWEHLMASLSNNVEAHIQLMLQQSVETVET